MRHLNYVSGIRITVTPLFSGLCRFPHGWHFKQMTGDDSKALMKVVFVLIISNHIYSIDQISTRFIFPQLQNMCCPRCSNVSVPFWISATWLDGQTLMKWLSQQSRMLLIDFTNTMRFSKPQVFMTTSPFLTNIQSCITSNTFEKFVHPMGSVLL